MHQNYLRLYKRLLTTLYKNTKETYCPMHLARIKRHGHPGLQTDFHKLEKMLMLLLMISFVIIAGG